MYHKIERIHLIGAGGIGVSGIAEILLQHGYRVSGSDLKTNDTVRRLQTLGMQFFLGHRAENIQGADLIVYSSAVGAENPEMLAAKALRVLAIPRAEMLAELMRLKYGIAVAGAHGKTTTTSMISVVLMDADLDPTIVVGGRMDNFNGTNARMGHGQFMVTEADESDGSFNKLTPSIAIVTNIDREHMEYYKTMRKLKSSFLSFLNKVPFYGLSIICGDDPYLRLLQRKITRRNVSYGFGAHNDYRVESYEGTAQGSRATIRYRDKLETLCLQVPGKHNLLNAIAALALADELSIERSHSIKSLESYQGVQRRFHFRGERNGVTLVDDYAHHPTEIQATLEAARERFPKGKVHVIFQPHRFSRVEDLFQEFSTCFRNADTVYVNDIYAAGELPIEEVSSDFLVKNMHRLGLSQASYVPSTQVAMNQLLELSRPGDVIFTLGAGDIVNVYQGLL